MNRLPLLLFSLFLSTLCLAQSPVDVGRGGMETTATDMATGADAFTASFPAMNVGFLHIYVDPEIDPLETYLLRGTEMSEAAVDMLPGKFKRLAVRNNGTFYGAGAIMGIEEKLYMTRMEGDRRDQIDMFAVRNGKVKHLKTIAYLDCGGQECLQMDSYITDVNLDTDLDLIQIARRYTESSGTTDERRRVFTMLESSRKWKQTRNMDVPWEGITFYEKGMNHEE